MSLLQEVIEQYCRADESSEIPGVPSAKSDNKGFGTYGTGSLGRSHISNEPESTCQTEVVSVDALSERLRESTDELQREAEDDWQEVSNDPAQLIAFADLVATNQIRESGRVPDTYTAKTHCKECGPVPIFPGCPPEVNGCPWCRNRHLGLPMPSTNQGDANAK